MESNVYKEQMWMKPTAKNTKVVIQTSTHVYAVWLIIKQGHTVGLQIATYRNS